MDIMPTFIEVAGANHPGTRSGNEILPMQGSSLTDLIQGVNDTFFSQRGFGSELFGIRAYRLGNWKILKLPPPYGTGNWQLYNLSTDPGETTDLASKHPGRLKELAKSWQAYAKENGVVEPDKLTLYAKPPR
jgi:arylsulfatase